MLTCDQAEKMVLPYINDELSDSELEDFLHHIYSCNACMEELEITFAIRMGLLELDDRMEDADIAQALNDRLDRSWVRVRSGKVLDVMSYAVDTLCAVSVAVALIMQIFAWIH